MPLKKKWGGLATTRVTDDPELVELLVRSGCQYLLLGFESISQRSLNRIAKGFNAREDYAEVMDRLHQARIVVQGCFVFGFDEDETSVFAATVEEVQRLKIDIPRYSLYTPYPGTPLFQRLQAENRILTYDWGQYDTMHVVIQPKGMTPGGALRGLPLGLSRDLPLAEHCAACPGVRDADADRAGRQRRLSAFRAADRRACGFPAAAGPAHSAGLSRRSGSKTAGQPPRGSSVTGLILPARIPRATHSRW